MILGAATPMRKDAARVAISPAPCQPRRSAPIRQCSPRSALSSKLGLSHALPLSPRAISPNVELFAAQPLVALRRLAHMKMRRQAEMMRRPFLAFLRPCRRASSAYATALLQQLLHHSAFLLARSCQPLRFASGLPLTLHLAGVLWLQPLHRTKLPPSCTPQCLPHLISSSRWWLRSESRRAVAAPHRRGRGRVPSKHGDIAVRLLHGAIASIASYQTV